MCLHGVSKTNLPSQSIVIHCQDCKPIIPYSLQNSLRSNNRDSEQNGIAELTTVYDILWQRASKIIVVQIQESQSNIIIHGWHTSTQVISSYVHVLHLANFHEVQVKVRSLNKVHDTYNKASAHKTQDLPKPCSVCGQRSSHLVVIHIENTNSVNPTIVGSHGSRNTPRDLICG